MIAALDLPTADARARGLSSHLLSRAELERLAQSGSLVEVAQALARSGRLTAPIEAPATVETIDLAIRRTSSRRLAVIAKWTGSRAALDVFFADQDRKIVRAAVRGAIQGARVASRLAGLLATPRLPERALSELARQPTPAKVADHLVVLRHPYAEVLVSQTAHAHPTLFDLELALVRAFAARSMAAARRGDAGLVGYVRHRVDVCNLELALKLANDPKDVDPESCFVALGSALRREAFVAAARAPTVGEAMKLLAKTDLGALVATMDADPGRIERVALTRAIAEQRRASRLDPLGSAALVSFLLRLEAQSLDLHRIVSAVSLGAPASLVLPELVTPWS